MSRRLTFLVFSGLMLSADWFAPNAQAACTWPELSLLWSYPEDGAFNVPTNALLWTATSGGVSKLEATLNKRPVRVVALNGGEHRLEPGTLKASTRYELELVYTGVFGGEASESQRTMRISFRTGRQRAQAAPTPVLLKHSELEDDAELAASRSCNAYWRAQGCVDAIGPRPSKLHQLEVAGSSPLAWLLVGSREDTTLLWPASCGQPSVVIPNSASGECITVRTIGEGGQPSPEQRSCAPVVEHGTHTEDGKPNTPSQPVQARDATPAPHGAKGPARSEPPSQASAPPADDESFGLCSFRPDTGPRSLRFSESFLGVLLAGVFWRRRARPPGD